MKCHSTRVNKFFTIHQLAIQLATHKSYIKFNKFSLLTYVNIKTITIIRFNTTFFLLKKAHLHGAAIKKMSQYQVCKMRKVICHILRHFGLSLLLFYLHVSNCHSHWPSVFNNLMVSRFLLSVFLHIKNNFIFYCCGAKKAMRRTTRERQGK